MRIKRFITVMMNKCKQRFPGHGQANTWNRKNRMNSPIQYSCFLLWLNEWMNARSGLAKRIKQIINVWIWVRRHFWLLPQSPSYIYISNWKCIKIIVHLIMWTTECVPFILGLCSSDSYTKSSTRYFSFSPLAHNQKTLSPEILLS